MNRPCASMVLYTERKKNSPFLFLVGARWDVLFIVTCEIKSSFKRLRIKNKKK